MQISFHEGQTYVISLKSANDPLVEVKKKIYFKEGISLVKQNIGMIVQNYMCITYIGKLKITLTIIIYEMKQVPGPG